jgi:hypothetical protein
MNQIHAWIGFLGEHRALLWWLASASAVMFVGTIVIIPIIVVRIPEDYFTRESRHNGGWTPKHPVLRLAILALKNLAGILLILTGILMLVGPGQGALSILIGIMLLDFPGKYRLETAIIRRRPVYRTINWIRAKAHRPPLKIPQHRSN